MSDNPTPQNLKKCNPVQPTRMCKRCLNYYHHDCFNKTAKGALKYICLDCEEARKEEQKVEQRYLQKIQRSNIWAQSLKVKIISTNKQVDLNNVKSLTVNFDK